MIIRKNTWFVIFSKEFLKQEKKLFDLNKNEIRQSNIDTFSFISFIMLVVGLLLFTGSLLFSYKMGYTVFTAVFYSLALVLAVLFKFARGNAYTVLPLVYIETAIINCATIFASIFSHSGMHLAVSFTCMQIILPILLFDKSWRLNAYFILIYVIHTVLTFILKPKDVALLDFLGTTVFSLTGLLLGTYFRYTRLLLIDKERILTFQRDTDVLSGLYNRRSLFVDIEKLMKFPVLNVIMFDIDYFKIFNDTYGHLAGDDCLRAVCECFKEIEKSYHIKFYRFGGEEFTALSSEYSLAELAGIAEKTRLRVESMNKFFIHGINGHVTISAGYSVINTEPGMTAEVCIKQADDALYSAKENGRNRTEAYSIKP
ncbi:MAG: GGDEF domain-containing protein [Treponema sp.]|nr:GGDEF domain-containing protein [Treponema sp.]